MAGHTRRQKLGPSTSTELGERRPHGLDATQACTPKVWTHGSHRAPETDATRVAGSHAGATSRPTGCGCAESGHCDEFGAATMNPTWIYPIVEQAVLEVCRSFSSAMTTSTTFTSHEPGFVIQQHDLGDNSTRLSKSRYQFSRGLAELGDLLISCAPQFEPYRVMSFSGDELSRHPRRPGQSASSTAARTHPHVDNSLRKTSEGPTHDFHRDRRTFLTLEL